MVWPLGLVFWGRAWTLVAWCELRQAYRMFRLDRIGRLQLVAKNFETTDTISLQHYLEQVKCSE
ncbi:helix-turn-helix transcriptional regulator [Neptunomonas japonica]|uniref:helix-turn-helix transcriptional regulator n=1 Tax=Neptunomonas japonica TaxID=417574 RepID=UPI000414E40C|nr:WYL domain-containing protein [Neptunomonas japonica]